MATHNGPPNGVMLDLGTGDVHVAAASGAVGGYAQNPTKPAKPKKVKPAKKRVGIRVRAQLAKGGYLSVRHTDLKDGDRAAEINEAEDGSLEFRDLRRITSADTVSPEVAGVTLVGPSTWADGSAKTLVWVQLAETGSWRGHAAGPFEMTSTTFSEIVRNFERRGLPIPFDMEHASEQDATSGTIPALGAPAHGWVHKMENRGQGGLWGLVEWLDYARDGIKDGRFAFLSPAMRLKSRDPVTGENVGARLTSVALTNQPFLTGLGTLRAAKDRLTETTMTYQIKGGPSTLLATDANLSTLKPEEFLPALRAALQLPALAPTKRISEALAQLRDHVEAAGDADATHDGIALSEFTRPLIALFDAQTADTWDDVFDAADVLVALAHPKKPPTPPASATAQAPVHPVTAPVAIAATQKEDTMTTANTTVTATDNKDTEAKLAELSLGLKDLQGKVSEQEKLVLAKDEEIKTLRNDIAKRDEKARADRVDEAFETYKDKKNLTDLDKPMLSVFLTANAEAFEKLYPRVTVSQRHLLADITTKRAPGNAGGVVPPHAGGDGGNGADADVPTISQLAIRLSDEKGIELGEAQRIVVAAAARAHHAA